MLIKKFETRTNLYAVHSTKLCAMIYEQTKQTCTVIILISFRILISRNSKAISDSENDDNKRPIGSIIRPLLNT